MVDASAWVKGWNSRAWVSASIPMPVSRTSKRRRESSSARRIEDPWLASSLAVATLVFCLNATTDASLHNDWEGWTFVVLASIACASRAFAKR